LLYTIVIPIAVNLIVLLALGLALSVDLDSPEGIDALISSHVFLIPGTIITAFFAYLGGRAVGKRTPGHERKFGIMLSILSLIIVGGMYLIPVEDTSRAPWYYDLISFAIIIALPIYGALSMRGKSTGAVASPLISRDVA